ncbi:MAG TPA: hypothetical protein V6D29_06765 [Leptolyngbyaceae cyanobacterium]
MSQVREPLLNTSPELSEVWGIVQSTERSFQALERLRELYNQAQDEEDRDNISWMINGFFVSSGNLELWALSAPT